MVAQPLQVSSDGSSSFSFLLSSPFFVLSLTLPFAFSPDFFQLRRRGGLSDRPHSLFWNPQAGLPSEFESGAQIDIIYNLDDREISPSLCTVCYIFSLSSS
jgi:hypothetical protein